MRPVDADDKMFWWVLIALVLVVGLICSILIVHGKRVDDGKYLYTVTWHSPSGEVRTYERATNPGNYEACTNFFVPDGTEVTIRDGVVEIKKNAEKP